MARPDRWRAPGYPQPLRPGAQRGSDNTRHRQAVSGLPPSLQAGVRNSGGPSSRVEEDVDGYINQEDASSVQPQEFRIELDISGLFSDADDDDDFSGSGESMRSDWEVSDSDDDGQKEGEGETDGAKDGEDENTQDQKEGEDEDEQGDEDEEEYEAGEDDDEEEDGETDEETEEPRIRRRYIKRPSSRTAFYVDRDDEDGEDGVDDEDDDPRGRSRRRDMDNLHHSPSPEVRELSPGQRRIRQEGQVRFADFEMVKYQLRRMEEALRDKQALLDQEKQARRQDSKAHDAASQKNRHEFHQMRIFFENKLNQYRDLSYGDVVRDAHGVQRDRGATRAESAVELYKQETDYLSQRVKWLEEDKTQLKADVTNAKESLLAEIMPSLVEPLHEQIVDAQLAAEDAEAKYQREAARAENLERNVEAFELAKRQFQTQIRHLQDELDDARADRDQVLRESSPSNQVSDDGSTDDDSTQARVQELENDNRAATSEIERLRNAVSSSMANVESLQKALERKEADLANAVTVLREEKEAAEERHAHIEHQWQDRFDKSQKEIKTLKISLRQTHDQLSKAHAENERSELAATDEIETLKAKLIEEELYNADRLKATIEEVERLKQSLKATQDDRQRVTQTLEQNIADLQQQNEALKSDLQEEQSHNAGLVEQSKNDHGKIMATLHEQVNSLRFDLKSAQRSIHELEQKAKDDEKSHNTAVLELNEQIDALTTSTKLLEEREKKSAEAANIARNDAQDLGRLLQGREFQIRTMKTKLDDLQDRSTGIEETSEQEKKFHDSIIAELRSEIESLRLQLTSSERGVSGSSQQHDDRARIKKYITTLEAKLVGEKSFSAYLVKQRDRAEQEMSDVVAAAGSGPASLYDLLRKKLLEAEQSLRSSQQTARTTQGLLSRSISDVPETKRALLEELQQQLQERDEDLRSRKLDIVRLKKELNGLKQRLAISEQSLNSVEPPKVRQFLEQRLHECEKSLARSLRRTADAQRQIRVLEDRAMPTMQEDDVARDLLMEKKLCSNLQKENDELKATCVELTRKLQAQPGDREMALINQSPTISALAAPSRAVDILSLMGGPPASSPAIFMSPSASGILPPQAAFPQPTAPANNPRRLRNMEAESSAAGLLSAASELRRAGDTQSNLAAVPLLRGSAIPVIPSSPDQPHGSQAEVSLMLTDIAILKRELLEARSMPCENCGQRQQPSMSRLPPASAVEIDDDSAPCSNYRTRFQKVTELKKALKAERMVSQRLREAISGQRGDADEIQRLDESLKESVQALDSLVAQLGLSSQGRRGSGRPEPDVVEALSKAPIILRARETRLRGKVYRLEYDLQEERKTSKQLLQEQQNLTDQLESLVKEFGQSRRSQGGSALPSPTRKNSAGDISLDRITQCKRCAKLSQDVYQVQLAYDPLKRAFFVPGGELVFAQPGSTPHNVLAHSLWSFCILAGHELRLEWQYLSQTGLLRLMAVVYVLGLAALSGIETFLAVVLISLFALLMVLVLLASFYPFDDLFQLPGAGAVARRTSSASSASPASPPPSSSPPSSPLAASSSGAVEENSNVPTKRTPSSISETRTYKTHSSWAGRSAVNDSAKSSPKGKSSRGSGSTEFWQEALAGSSAEEAVALLEGKTRALGGAYNNVCYMHMKSVERCRKFRTAFENEILAKQEHESSAARDDGKTVFENDLKIFLLKVSSDVQLWKHYVPWEDPGADAFPPPAELTTTYIRRREFFDRFRNAYAKILRHHGKLMMRCESLLRASTRRDEKWDATLERFLAGVQSMLEHWQRWQSQLVIIDGRYSIPLDEQPAGFEASAVRDRPDQRLSQETVRVGDTDG